VRAILGLEDHATLQQTLQQLGAAKWGAVATTAAATAGVILGARFTPRIPAMLAGFLSGNRLPLCDRRNGARRRGSRGGRASVDSAEPERA
jgi:hypothetical protein